MDGRFSSVPAKKCPKLNKGSFFSVSESVAILEVLRDCDNEACFTVNAQQQPWQASMSDICITLGSG
jgi:hypothetical protein